MFSNMTRILNTRNLAALSYWSNQQGQQQNRKNFRVSVSCVRFRQSFGTKN